MRVVEQVRRIGAVSAELIRHRRASAIPTISKALLARISRGIDVESFAMLGLQESPASSWPDWMSYYNELEAGLRALNWQGDGKRLTVDKLATAERLADAGIAAPHIYAVIGRDRSVHPHKDLFPAPDSVEAILARLGEWPDALFVKPADGWQAKASSGRNAATAAGRWEESSCRTAASPRSF